MDKDVGVTERLFLFSPRRKRIEEVKMREEPFGEKLSSEETE